MGSRPEAEDDAVTEENFDLTALIQATVVGPPGDLRGTGGAG